MTAAENIGGIVSLIVSGAFIVLLFYGIKWLFPKLGFKPPVRS